MAEGSETSPSAIRARARARFHEQLATLSELASDETCKPADRIAAIRALGDYGMGKADQAAVHVHAEGSVTLGVVHLPELGTGERSADAREAGELPAGADHALMPPSNEDE